MNRAAIRTVRALVNRAQARQDVLRIHVPMPVLTAKTPTLAEVRWFKGLPFHRNGLYFVGLKFLLCKERNILL